MKQFCSNFAQYGALLAVTTICASIATQAAAQKTTPPVEEIVVTAQKRSERIQDVPISVVVATGAKLEAIGVTNLQDIAQVTVGVNISYQGNFVQPTIRGIGSQTGQSGQDNNVAVYVDGVYQASASALNQELVDLKSMQILKGPQGTLFGRNSTAGAVLVETLDPSFTPTGRVRASYGRFNDWSLQGYYSAPLVSDRLAFAATAYYRKSDGFLKDLYNRYKPGRLENDTFRGKLLFKPNDNLRITLSGMYAEIDDPGNATYQTLARNVVAAETGVAYASQPYVISHTTPDFNHDIMRTFNLSVEYTMGWATLKSISSYTHENLKLGQESDGTIVARSYNDALYSTSTATQEFNLLHTGKKLDWVLGAFVYYQDAPFDGTTAFTAPNLTTSGPILGIGGMPGRQGEIYRSESYAGFADGTYRITDRLAIIGGVRYSLEKKIIISPYPFTTPNPALATSSRAYLQNSKASKHWGKVTPRISIRYEVAHDTNVYASFSEGFKSGTYGSFLPSIATGGTNPAFIAGNNPANPEKVFAYEIGLKTVQPTWRLDLAGFYYDYRNLQVQAVGLLPPPSTFQALQLTNAANSKIYGLEANGSVEVDEHLTLNAAVAWTHARYTQYPTAQSYGLCPVTTRTINGVTAPWDATGLVNFSGVSSPCVDTSVAGAPAVPAGYNTRTTGLINAAHFQMLRAPTWNLNFGFDYTLPTAVGEFGLNTNIFYTSSYATNELAQIVPGTFRDVVNAYWMVNGQVTFVPAFNDKLMLTLYGKNLANEVIYHNPDSRNFGDRVIYAPPRSYGVRIDYRF